MPKSKSYKLVYYNSSSYIFRGVVCLTFLALILIAQICSFSPSINMIFALIVYFLGGSLFISAAIKELFGGHIGFNAFISFSVFLALAFGIMGQIHISSINTGWVFANITLTLMLANFIKAGEIKNLKYSFKFMESLDNFIPNSCTLITAKGNKKVFCEEVKIGDVILLRNAQRLPFDGEIIKGSSLFDENLLTGNITLASKQVGNKVLAGSVNKGTDVEIKILSSRKTSHIARVLEAVKQSENKKIIKTSTLERSALSFLLTTVFIGVILGGLFYFANSANYYEAFLKCCLFVLLMSPISYMLSVIWPWGYTAKNTFADKIKINDITVLERLDKTNKVFIDKTGTLTTGRLQVAEIIPAEGIKEDALMKAALSTQQNAQNIFALALKDWGVKNKMTSLKLSALELHPSYGALVRSGADTYLAGRRTWLEGKGVNIPVEEDEVKKTVFYVAKNKEFLGRIYFTDRLRTNAAATVKYLTDLGKTVCLISGDNTLSITATAKKAGIREYYGNMYPKDKAAKISAEQNLGAVTTMIGDGFNDILALLEADASLAFVPSNNLFTSWVDVIIKGKDFTLVRKIFELHNKTRNRINLNLLLTVFISLLCYYYMVMCDKNNFITFLSFWMLNICIIFLNSVRLKYE